MEKNKPFPTLEEQQDLCNKLETDMLAEIVAIVKSYMRLVDENNKISVNRFQLNLLNICSFLIGGAVYQLELSDEKIKKIISSSVLEVVFKHLNNFKEDEGKLNAAK